MSLDRELRSEFQGRGADFIHFVDVSKLSGKQNRGFSTAILLGMVLSPEYIKEITCIPDYVQNMIRCDRIKIDEFHLKELGTDRLADEMAHYLTVQGYSAYSQSEDNLIHTGEYDERTRTSPLPHKTIALMAGMEWIGKYNLLVTLEFGSALSFCTVLTNAPVTTVLHTPADSQCGDCRICQDVCSPGALKGRTWGISTSRDELLDADKCTTCLKCLAFCPWTERYASKHI